MLHTISCCFQLSTVTLNNYIYGWDAVASLLIQIVIAVQLLSVVNRAAVGYRGRNWGQYSLLTSYGNDEFVSKYNSLIILYHLFKIDFHMRAFLVVNNRWLAG